MTGATKAIYSQLEALGIYRLGRDSLVDKELMAYDVGFAVVEEALAQALRTAFLPTAAGDVLAAWEGLVGLGDQAGLDEGTRRELVLYRLGVAARDNTGEGIRRSLLAAGVDAGIEEHPHEEALTVRSNVLLDLFADLDAIKKRISAMLPAHLDWELEAGFMTWDMLEETGVYWDAWDSIGFTWDMFEIDGYNILKKGGGA